MNYEELKTSLNNEISRIEDIAENTNYEKTFTIDEVLGILYGIRDCE